MCELVSTDSNGSGHLPPTYITRTPTRVCLGGNISDEYSQLYETKIRDGSMSARIVAIFFLTCIGAAGAVLNGLVLLVLAKRTFRKRPMEITVLFIAGLDLITCLFVIPGNIYSIVQLSDLGDDARCKLWMVLNKGTAAASLFALLLLTFLRYRKVCHPFSWQVTFGRARAVIVVIVVLGLLASIPFYIFIERTMHNLPTRPVTGYSPFFGDTDAFFADAVAAVTSSKVTGLSFGVLFFCPSASTRFSVAYVNATTGTITDVSGDTKSSSQQGPGDNDTSTASTGGGLRVYDVHVCTAERGTAHQSSAGRRAIEPVCGVVAYGHGCSLNWRLLSDNDYIRKAASVFAWSTILANVIMSVYAIFCVARIKHDPFVRAQGCQMNRIDGLNDPAMCPTLNKRPADETAQSRGERGTTISIGVTSAGATAVALCNEDAAVSSASPNKVSSPTEDASAEPVLSPSDGASNTTSRRLPCGALLSVGGGKRPRWSAALLFYYTCMCQLYTLHRLLSPVPPSRDFFADWKESYFHDCMGAVLLYFPCFFNPVVQTFDYPPFQYQRSLLFQRVKRLLG